MKYYSHLNTAGKVLEAYPGNIPFQIFIKDFFRQHKKYGSADRRSITQLCYCFLRTGSLLHPLPKDLQLPAALFLCAQDPTPLLHQLQPGWNAQVGVTLDQKLTILALNHTLDELFPCYSEISSAINKDSFVRSHLIQPDVFLRIRPSQREAVLHKLRQANISFQQPTNESIALAATTRVDDILTVNKEVVIQDLSSQATGQQLLLIPTVKSPMRVWDCCAASGGKSIMATDILGTLKLTVSDIRESVLANLKKRFAAAGIIGFTSIQADLSKPVMPATAPFQLVIADVPCTGSGTWGRAPEHLANFQHAQIEDFQERQQKIMHHVLPHLENNGYLLYITCSVYAKENEDNVKLLQENHNMELISMQYLKGYELKADTLFAALLQKK